jgi:hypothetical protein
LKAKNLHRGSPETGVSKHQLQRSPIRFKGRADPSHIYLNSDSLRRLGNPPMSQTFRDLVSIPRFCPEHSALSRPPQERRESGPTDLFRARLDQIVNLWRGVLSFFRHQLPFERKLATSTVQGRVSRARARRDPCLAIRRRCARGRASSGIGVDFVEAGCGEECRDCRPGVTAPIRRNQELVADSANVKRFMSRGAVRPGEALLPGLFRCAQCGKKLHVRYGGDTYRYECVGSFKQLAALEVSFV